MFCGHGIPVGARVAARPRTHPGPRSRPRAAARTEAAELREAIFDAGYAPSGVRYLIGASPAHERVGARRNSGYRLRGVQPEVVPSLVEIEVAVKSTTGKRLGDLLIRESASRRTLTVRVIVISSENDSCCPVAHLGK